MFNYKDQVHRSNSMQMEIEKDKTKTEMTHDKYACNVVEKLRKF